VAAEAGAGAADAPVVDRAEDGTALFAPRGVLPVEVDGSRVQCHFVRSVVPPTRFGARRAGARGDGGRVPGAGRAAPPAPAQGAAVRARHGAVMRALIEIDARVRQGMEIGLKLARGRRIAARR
jgi:hypothetical protein